MANAKRLGREDVYKEAFRQLCGSEGRNIDDPLELGVAVTLRRSCGVHFAKRDSPPSPFVPERYPYTPEAFQQRQTPHGSKLWVIP